MRGARHRADFPARAILDRGLSLADDRRRHDGYIISASRLLRIFVGFLVAAVSGIMLGLLMGMSRIVCAHRRSLDRRALSAAEDFAHPLLIIWLGTGEAYKIVISAVTAFFPIVISTYAGIRQVDRGLIRRPRISAPIARQIQLKVVIPAAMPSILAGLQLGMGVTIILVVAAEMIGGSSHERHGLPADQRRASHGNREGVRRPRRACGGQALLSSSCSNGPIARSRHGPLMRTSADRRRATMKGLEAILALGLGIGDCAAARRSAWPRTSFASARGRSSPGAGFSSPRG